MDELRWILIVAGGCLIVGIYAYARKKDPNKESLFTAAKNAGDALFGGKSKARPHKDSPDLGDLNEISDDLAEFNVILEDSKPASQSTRPAVAKKPKKSWLKANTKPEVKPTVDDAPDYELIIALHLVARKDERFYGVDLLDIFTERGYEFGQLDIYHLKHDEITLFSIANMFKPGSFDPKRMQEFSTTGISMFLGLPAAIAADMAYDTLLNEAHALANALGGVLQDESHSTLTTQTIQHQHDAIREFMFKHKND